MAEPFAYTVIATDDSKDQPTVQELRTLLENPKEQVKIDAMKQILTIMLGGDPLNSLLMHVIRFVMPHESKVLKKLLVLYWEIIQKTDNNGKLKQEMVLVCNALRNDLLHPNEFIRGQMLRFLCKLKETEILEPLIPSIRSCLEHKHPYVRKNAVLAIYSIFKVNQILIPDANELIRAFINAEPDISARRNALIMLINTNLPFAVEYYHSIAAQLSSLDEQFQLAVIDLIRKDSRNPTADKAKYIQSVINLLGAPSAAVRFEAASILVYLTSHASAIKSAASCYIELAAKESDNNVKLIVLERLYELAQRGDRVLEQLVMEVLRILSSPDIAVKTKALSLVLDLVSSRTVEEVIAFLKKELLKTHEQDYDKVNEYRQLLIKNIHACAIKFPELADSVVHVLMEFLGDSNTASAVDVIAFVREVMEKFEHLRGTIATQILENILELRTSRVFRGALWIIGEYCHDAEMILKAKNSIVSAIGEIPIVAAEEKARNTEPDTENNEKLPSPVKKKVLADGTYATESAFTYSAKTNSASTKPPLRTLLLGGDYFVGSVLATCLTKLSLRFSKLADPKSVNAFTTECMLIITSIIRLGKSEYSLPIDEDSYGRMMTCIRVLSKQQKPGYDHAFLEAPRQAFHNLVSAKDKLATKKLASPKAGVEELISFRLLRDKKQVDAGELYTADLTRATGTGAQEDQYVSKLDKIVQLTGFSDIVYAEAYVTVHQYDIVLDILIINQSSETLQNLTVEFSTLGDLKLVERPAPHTLGPHGFHSLKANIKVSSTESGAIFSSVVYDGPASAFNCVILNEINIDIMDYIKPASCSEGQFRSMWSEFEWENRVNVSSATKDLRNYFQHILKVTNMNCLTPERALLGNCGFLAANMHARSIFGEDALANICLESDGEKISGHVRIRSKTQGIALALGEKITLAQRLIKQELQ